MTPETTAKQDTPVEQIQSFKEFFEGDLYPYILQSVREGHYFLHVPFTALSKFDPELAHSLLEKPDEIIHSAEMAIRMFDLDLGNNNFRVRFHSLPGSQDISIRDIRSKHLNQFRSFTGIIKQKSEVRPQAIAARFECPSCGNVINVLQLDGTFNEPTRCGCGRKGKFHELSKELVDAQSMVIEDAPEVLHGGEQPQRINVFLKDDLVSPMTARRLGPGSKVIVNGIVKEVPIINRTGKKSSRFDLIIEANSMEFSQESFYDIEISNEDVLQIKELAQDPDGYQKILQSMAPTIHGYEKEKEAIFLQMLGGIRKIRRDGTTLRGDTHILLVGDPGSGKSQLLKRAATIAPKSRYVSGKGASGVGLTAAVVRDEFLKGWALEAGALVLASGGLGCIDEIEKMKEEDEANLHEAMEQQTVSVSKANIQSTLIAQTTILAAANPKHGRFDPYGVLAQQITLKDTLINRFDLIFPIRDIPDDEADDQLAEHILNTHRKEDFAQAPLSTDFLKRYIAYSKQYVHPVLTQEAHNEIKRFYLKMRRSGYEGSSVKTIAINARQLEALIRITEARARSRLSDTADVEDARCAMELLEHCLMKVGFDQENGKIDIDRIAVGVATSQRDTIRKVKEIYDRMAKDTGKVLVSLDEMAHKADEEGITLEKFEEAIRHMIDKDRDYFQPRSGWIGYLS